MRSGEIGWAIVLAGLPWSFFLVRLLVPFQGLDIWHSNTWWMQAGILVMATVQGGKVGRLPRPLWALASWASLTLLWSFTAQLHSGQPYPVAMLTGMGHLWFVLLAALLLTGLQRPSLERITQAVFWSGVGLVVYGWLQVMNLDQFFHWVDV